MEALGLNHERFETVFREMHPLVAYCNNFLFFLSIVNRLELSLNEPIISYKCPKIYRN